MGSINTEPNEDTPTTVIALNDEKAGEQWAAIATNAEAEPGRAMTDFELRVLGLLRRKPKDLSYWLQRAVGQWEQRVAAAELALTEANRHRPAHGWRPLDEAAG